MNHSHGYLKNECNKSDKVCKTTLARLSRDEEPISDSRKRRGNQLLDKKRRDRQTVKARRRRRPKCSSNCFLESVLQTSEAADEEGLHLSSHDDQQEIWTRCEKRSCTTILLQKLWEKERKNTVLKARRLKLSKSTVLTIIIIERAIIILRFSFSMAWHYLCKKSVSRSLEKDSQRKKPLMRSKSMRLNECQGNQCHAVNVTRRAGVTVLVLCCFIHSMMIVKREVLSRMKI